MMPRGRKRRYTVDHRRLFRAHKNVKVSNLSPGPSSDSQPEDDLERLAEVLVETTQGDHRHEEVTEESIQAAVAAVSDVDVDDNVLIRSAQNANRNHFLPQPERRNLAHEVDAIELSDSSISEHGN